MKYAPLFAVAAALVLLPGCGENKGMKTPAAEPGRQLGEDVGAPMTPGAPEPTDEPMQPGSSAEAGVPGIEGEQEAAPRVPVTDESIDAPAEGS
jgi:hypothetical protein